MSEGEKHHQLIQQILSGARAATLLRIIAQMISWASTLIVVRYVSPEDYGLNAMLEAPLVLLMVISTLGLETALVQAKNVDTESLRSAFGFLIILDSALFLIYFLGAPYIAAYFNEPRLDMLAKVLAFLFLLIPFRVVPNALLDRKLDFKLRAKVELISSVAAALITLGLAYQGAGVWALVLGVVLGRVLQTLILMFVCPWFVAPRFNLRRAREMVYFGSVVTVASIITLLSDQLVSLIAGPRLGAEVLGVFVLGAQFALMPLSKGMPILNQTMLPAFAKFQGDRKAASYYLEKLLGVAALVFFPLLLGMVAVANTLVATIFGAKWTLAVLPLSVLSVSMIFRMTTLLVRTTVLAMGRADLPAYLSILQFVLMLPMIALGTEFGIAGLVTACVLVEIVVALVTLSLARKVLDISFIRVARAYKPSLISSLLMVGIVIMIEYQFTELSGWLLLLTEIIFGAVMFVVIVRYAFEKQFKIAASVMLGKVY